MRIFSATKRTGRHAATRTLRRLECAIEPMESRILMSAVTLASTASTITDIEKTGPFGTSSAFAPVAGTTGNGASVFSSFEVYEFDSGSPIFPAPSTIASLTNLNLSQFNSAISGSFNGVAGSTFNVYLIPNTTAQTPTGSLVFNTDVTGLVGQAGLTPANASSYELGSIAFTDAATGFSSSTFTSSGASVADSTLLSDLTNNQTFRIAVTPATATSAADYNGNDGTSTAKESAIFTVTAAGTPAEQFNFTNASYSVNETAGNAYFSVTRTGDTSDAATVNFATNDGSAFNGVNYTAESGTINFAIGQQVANVVVPITNVSPQGGNRNFTISLSSPSASVNPATLGATATATVTIIDTAPLTNNLSAGISSVKDIETDGSFSTTFTSVVGDNTAGSSSFNFLSYEVLEFTQASSPSIFPATGFTVNSLQNLSLQLFNTATTGNFTGHPGTFDVYFMPNSETTTPTAALVYNVSDPTGLDGQGGTSAATLLGAFSFSGAAKSYDTYTPAAIPAAVASALVADLNNGTTFRLVVTPGATGKGGVAADWSGIFTGETPILSLSANVTQVAQPETIAFQSAALSVNENAGTETITLTRSGATTDSATVDYATSDGSAIAGTNYTATSGVATFGVGSTQTSFTIPIDDALPQGGNKVLTVTLSNPSSAGPNTIATLGTPSTATVTIIDSSTAPTETLTQFASDVSDVEKNGPFENTVMKVEGSAGITGFPSYGVADFNDPNSVDPNGDPLGITPANPVTAINSITLEIANAALGTTGPIDVYLVPDATSNIDASSPQSANPHFFDNTQLPEGLGTQFGTPMLLGAVNWSGSTPAFATSNALVPIALNNFSPATEQAIINDLNNGVIFRIVATPESSTVYADWEGLASSNGVYLAPQISLNVQEGTVPTLPPYITPSNGAVFTFDPTSGNLSLTSGTLTFTSDQATSGDPTLVNLTASGPGSNVVFDTNQHIAGLTLTGGATASIVSGAGATLNTLALSVNSGSSLDVTTNKVIITYGSAPNDPIAAIVSSLTTGYHAGTWTGTGITSSAAAINPTKFAVGYLDGNKAADTIAHTVSANEVELGYTLAGDAFLEGTVGFDDLVVVAQNFGFTGLDWAGGNFNYDPSGSVGFPDLVNVAQNFGISTFGASTGGTLKTKPASKSASVAVNPQPTPTASSSDSSSSATDDAIDTVLGVQDSSSEILDS